MGCRNDLTILVITCDEYSDVLYFEKLFSKKALPPTLWFYSYDRDIPFSSSILGV